MRVKAAKWGNSVAVRLPASVVQQLQVKPGGQFTVTASSDRLVLTPVRERRALSLAEMVAEARRLGPDFQPPGVDWGAARGAEFLADD